MNRIVLLAMLLTCAAALAVKDRQTGDKPKPAMEMILEKRYLNIPVNNRAPSRRMSLTVDGNRSLSASCGKGKVKARFLRVHELKSAWE